MNNQNQKNILHNRSTAIRWIVDTIIKIVYPPKCVLCGEVIPVKDWSKQQYLCSPCNENIPFIDGNICKGCGKPLREGLVYCSNCSELSHAFSVAVSAFRYSTIERAIKHMKFEGFLHDFIPLAYLMHRFLMEKCDGYLLDVDFITFVPMHPKKEHKRGFNQAMLLARELGRLTNIECKEDILYKAKPTKVQSSLSPLQRRENVKDAYKIRNKDAVEGKIILLVDDVYTTGSTINECTRILMMYGADKVKVATLGISTK